MTTPGESITESHESSVRELEQRLLSPDISKLERIDLLSELAWALRRLDSQRCFTLAQEAFELSEAENYKNGLASSLLARGFAHFRLSDYEAAQKDAEQAYALFEALELGSGSYRALNLIGITYGQLGDLSKALKTFLETHMLCEMLGDVQGAATALNNAALVHTHLSDYPNALELYLRALKLHEELADLEGITIALSNIASTYIDLNRFEEALEHFERCLGLKEEWDDFNLHSHILFQIGICQIELNQLDKALRNALDSKRIAEQAKDRLGVSNSLSILGLIFLKQGKLLQAEQAFREALEVFRAIGDPLGEVRTSLDLSELLLEQAKTPEALQLLEQTLLRAKTLEGKAELYRTHLALANTHEAHQNFKQAFFHYKSYSELKDIVFNDTSDQKLQSLRVSFQVEQTEREREIYRLKNIEFAQANEQLQSLNASLQDLDNQKSSLLKQLERQALQDPLTSLYNRRHFDTQIAKAFEQARAHQSPLSIMICDIDNFKNVNDSFSHQMGDEVLIKVAELFRTGINQSDILARYGGEEFILAMPNTSPELALGVCERLRKSVESYPWDKINAELNVTVSVGLCSDYSLEHFEKMIAFADDKLYEAKRSGKNKVCF